jgi:hypothetical protein
VTEVLFVAEHVEQQALRKGGFEVRHQGHGQFANREFDHGYGVRVNLLENALNSCHSVLNEVVNDAADEPVAFLECLNGTVDMAL